MTDLKKYFDYDENDDHHDGDETESCPFCGEVYPGEDEVQFEEWWGATECEHMCCFECADWSGSYPLCPRCAQEQRERNGKET